MKGKASITKRMLSVMIAVAMCMTGIPAIPAQAAEARTSEWTNAAIADKTPFIDFDFNTITGGNLLGLDFKSKNNNEMIAKPYGEQFSFSDRTNHYLNLTGDKYLTVTNAEGKSPLTGKNSVTIMYDSYRKADSGVAWAFYTVPSESPGIDTNFGIREDWNIVDYYYKHGTDPAQSIKLENFALATDKWKKIAVVVDGDTHTLTVYENGIRKKTVTNENAASLSEILGDESVFWIGRSNYGTEKCDAYIDNFQIYDSALTENQVKYKADREAISLLAEFDFENLSDNTFASSGENGVKAVATIPENSGELVETKENKALDLRGKTTGLYVTKQTGAPILKEYTMATVVFDSWYEGDNGNDGWPFYASDDVTQQDVKGIVPNHFGMKEITSGDAPTTAVPRKCADDSKADFELSTIGSADKTGPITGKWKQVAVVFGNHETWLYIDGKQRDYYKVNNGANINDILGASGGVFQIGRANWGTGQYYNGMLDNFQIYNTALTADEVQALYMPGEDADLQASKIVDFTFDDPADGFAYKDTEGKIAVARPFLTYDTDGDNDYELYMPETNKTYFSILQNNGFPLLGKDEITISYDSKPDTWGADSKWAFYAAKESAAPVNNQEEYLGILDRQNNLQVENWMNTQVMGSGSRVPFRYPSISADAKSTSGQWKHVDVVVRNGKTTLYVNGFKKGEVRTDHKLSELFTEQSIAQIGKGQWGTGEYYGGYIDNFRIYDGAIEPKVDSITVTAADGAEVTEDYIKVLAGHLREKLNVTATLNGETVTLGKTDYDVIGYRSECGRQTITISYQGATVEAKIDVYNTVTSTQKEVLDETGKPMFTVHSTWYDYLTDPERDGRDNYKSDSHIMQKDENGNFVNSDAEYVQFNNAISNYWETNLAGVNPTDLMDPAQYGHPIYWGDFYSLDEAYRIYNGGPNNMGREDVVDANDYYYEKGDGAPWRAVEGKSNAYGADFYGAIWGYNGHQYCKSAAQKIFDPDLNADNNITIRGKETPYFEDKALASDSQGDVYMNVYNDVLMPFETVDEDGIKYYQFNAGGELENDKTVLTESIEISEDPEKTVTWVDQNNCRDARDGYSGFDGTSFFPFNKNNETDKANANCGYGMRMDFNFYSTYDGKLPTNTGERRPIIFDFTGDDEFLFYIDGKLAIDIGGSHGYTNGKIDFAAQTVTISDVRTVGDYADVNYKTDGTDAGTKNIALDFNCGTRNTQNLTVSFADLGLDFSDPAKKHSAVIYYTERGKLEGNLKLKFNFPQENSLAVHNVVNADGVNPALKSQMDEIIANEKFMVDVKSDYTTGDGNLIPVSGETVAYNDGAAYTEGNITDGKVELKSNESALLVQRPATTEQPEGFLDQTGQRFAMNMTVDSRKYNTSWTLSDTTGQTLGTGGEEGTVIDDPETQYPASVDNKPNEFAIYNKNANSVASGELGAELTKLEADYVHTVKTGKLSVTKHMQADPNNENHDTFYFQVYLSDLFGSGSGETLYRGSYTLWTPGENGNISSQAETDENGYIRLKPRQCAVIDDIPVLTKCLVKEDINAGTYSEGKKYQTVGSAEHSGEIIYNGEFRTDIMNTEKNEDEFYVWRGHETTLPLNNVAFIGQKTDQPDENGKDTYIYSSAPYDNPVYYVGIKDEQSVTFTGKKCGNSLIGYKRTGDERIYYATVHVYEPDNKAYVLDYGLPVDLNQAGNDSFGISREKSGETPYNTIAGSNLSIASAPTVAEFKGFRVHSGDDTKWDDYQDVDQNQDVAISTDASAINWAEADNKVIYTPQKFMEGADVYDYRVDVKKNLTDDMDTYEALEAPKHGVRMAGNLTVVPASVVYYEDNFKAITVGGTHATEGTTENRLQSNDQDGAYGYDAAYAGEKDLAEDMLVHYNFQGIAINQDGYVVDPEAVVTDISGNGNNGTIRHIGEEATQAKIVDGALSLPGQYRTVEDINNYATSPTVTEPAYVEIPGEVFTGKKALTISMRLKNQPYIDTANRPASYTDAMYIGNKVSHLGDSPGRYWRFNPYDVDGVTRSVMSITSAGAGECGVVGTEPTDMTWHVYTHVFEEGYLTTYCDGVKIDTVNTGIQLADLGTNLESYIGKSQFNMINATWRYFRGQFSDFRVYDRALTEQEAARLATVTNGGIDTTVNNVNLDSAGSSTKLTANSGADRGSMEFTFTGTGFDLVGRTTTESAGISMLVRNGKTNELVKSLILDTYYANGSLYQLPLISVKDLAYGTYKVTVKAIKTSSKSDETQKLDNIYIDGIRIYNPAGAGKDGEKTEVTDHYRADEYKADTPEIRDLLLGGVKFENLEDILKNTVSNPDGDQTAGTENTTTASAESSVSLVTFAENGGTTIYHEGNVTIENKDGVSEKPVTSLEEMLRRGPNNEIYLTKGNAIAFRAVPVTETDADGILLIPESARTLQLEAKKAAGEEGKTAVVQMLTDRKTADNTFDAQTLSLKTYTPMYYKIDVSKCKQYADGSYLVILASTGDAMVSLTNLKVKGYTLQNIAASDFLQTAEVLDDTFALMSFAYSEQPEEPKEPGITDNPEEPEDPGTTDDPGDSEDKDPEKPLPFTDVAAGSWYEPYVRYVYEHGIMTGVGDTQFAPEQTLCRAQFAVMLYRMAGEPDVTYTDRFKDVPKGQFYTDAVLWASQDDVGVITGYTGGEKKGYFGAFDPITREQIAAMFYRYAKYQKEDVSVSSAAEFPDSAQVSDYAKTSVAWAAEKKLIQGDNGMLNPQGYTDRAMCAAIIQRYLEWEEL